MANVHPVNKIVYIIIAFFLGGLGIQDLLDWPSCPLCPCQNHHGHLRKV